jgi:hypothetical protein
MVIIVTVAFLFIWGAVSLANSDMDNREQKRMEFIEQCSQPKNGGKPVVLSKYDTYCIVDGAKIEFDG